MKTILSFFVLLIAATSALARPQDSVATQSVRGTIIDVSSGTPLQGATVRVLDGTELLGGAISDRRGAFTVKSVPVGRRTIAITFLGYEPYRAEDVLVTAGKEVVVNVQLTPSYAEVAAVGVEYDRILDAALTNNEYITTSGRAFNTEDTKRYAGALGDPSRMAANFAGVSGANDARNDIVVRGNSPSGMLWQMQGMNIPNPNHFGTMASTGGPVSMLNNNVLEKSDFLTSAFPAMYGNALSGAFDIRLRDGNTQSYEFLGQMGFNGLEVGAEGPLWEGASFLINYRYSTLALFNDVGIDLGTGGATPVYQDLTFKVQSPVGEHGRVELFGVGGMSDVSFLGNETDTTAVDFYNDRYRNTIVDYTTGWAGAAYEHRFGSTTTAKVTLGASSTYEAFRGDTILPETLQEIQDSEADIRTRTVSIVANVRHKFSRTTNMVAGGYVDIQNYDLYNIDNMQDGALPLVDIADQATLSQGYVQFRHRLAEWLTLNGGLHAQHYTTGDAFVIEPRAGITAMVTPSFTLNAGYGLHGQRQNIYTYNVQTPTADGVSFTNRDLGFTRSHHGVVGADWFITSDIRLKVEGYYQSLFDVPVTITPSSYSALNFGSSFAPDNTDSLTNDGTGTNMGLEVTLEHFFKDGFYFLATGSVFDSKYVGSDNVERNTAFNTGYVVNLLGGKEFRVGEHSVFAANIRFSTAGGRYLTPIDIDASNVAGSPIYDESRAFTERQDPYLRLDLKLAYRIEFNNSSLEFALDLQNVTNHQNVFSQGFDPSTGQITTQYQQGFFPVPMIRYTF